MRLQKFFLAFSFVVSVALAGTALAQNQNSAAYDLGGQLQAAAGENGAAIGDPVDPRYVASFIVRTILTVVGTVVFCYMVYAGYLWMSAGGNDEQVAQAKTTIRNCVVGLIVVVGAYGITLAATNLASGRPIEYGQGKGCGGLTDFFTGKC